MKRHTARSILLTATLATLGWNVSAQSWVPQISGTTASLRGVSAVDGRTAWASGSAGTVLRTTDGGSHWNRIEVPGAAELDFRDIEAFSASQAFVMSAGPGVKSRIYWTANGGRTWKLRYTNPDAKGFFDCMAFWNTRNGFIAGDQVDGKPVVLVTRDAGATWSRSQTPPALPNEGSFAAGGTCAIARQPHEAWFVTGGIGASRIFHSSDGASTWTVVPAPIRSDQSSSGVFSIAFSETRVGVAVGGNYAKPEETDRNAAFSNDGGRSWQPVPDNPPSGFRSAVAWIESEARFVATGTNGSDSSPDGQNWTVFDRGAYNALSFARDGSGWAVGPQGRIARMVWRP